MPHTPDGVGYRPTDTSQAAASGVASSRWCSLALAAIEAKPMTPDEVAAELGVTVLTIRPRMTQLKQAGLIIDTGERRKTASGRKAAVYRAKEPQCR